MPQEKLNKLFPERWVPEPDNIIKEAERMAALENPNISCVMAGFSSISLCSPE